MVKTDKLSQNANKVKAKTAFIKDWTRCIKRDYLLYLLLVPFILYYVIFVFKPMYGLQIAFKDYSLFKGIQNSPWVGFKHFIDFFTGTYFLTNLKNTVLISLLNIVVGFPMPIILALLFNEVKSKKFKAIGQTVTYLPHFISAVVVAGIVTNILSPESGLINGIIKLFKGEPIYFLTKPEYFRTIFTSMSVWKEAGFGSIIYTAALAAIDAQLYEAAYIDGASKWKQLIHITIPSILPTLSIMLILRIGRLLEVGYETIILLYQPATYKTADVISTYVFRSGIIDGNYSLASAAGLFNSAVALVLVISSNTISKKLSENGLW